MRCAVSNHVQLACVLVCQLNDYFITEDAKGNRSSSGCVFLTSQSKVSYLIHPFCQFFRFYVISVIFFSPAQNLNKLNKDFFSHVQNVT